MENGKITAILSMGSQNRISALAELGFSDGRLAAHNIEDIGRFLPDKIPIIIGLALDSPNPDSSLNFLERFLTASKENSLNISSVVDELPLFIKVFGSSEFLSSIIIKKPERAAALINSPYLKSQKPLELMKSELLGIVSGIVDYDSLLSALRLYKQDEMLRIGARDLMGYGPLEEIASELSSLASASLDTAYSFCLNLLKKEHGAPYFRDESGAWRECTFVVMGMGKLGGNELNFSSDIDLIYLYAEDGETSHAFPPPGGGKTLYEFYCKLAEMLTKAISSNTDEGFVFRVDLRLRPDGQNGPIVNSLRNAEAYYESWGETWERSAMLKARPVAGDISLGERFLKDIEPFIYRKYLDFSTIEDIKEMKLKIDRELALRPGMWNVKLGSGGIREVEFFVQASQLIYAGKDKSLRERNTLKSLGKLKEKGLLSSEDYERLTSAYRFLRTAEHRIQIESERQTHRLPRKGEELKRLAKRCGFKNEDAFMEALTFHSGNVEKLYDSMFHEPSKGIEGPPPEVAQLFDSELGKESVIEKLSNMGFEEAERAYITLKTLRDASFRLTHRGRSQLRRLAPHLFSEASRSPDPDMAILNLDKFLNAVGSKEGFYSLLIENPRMIKFLANLFGTSGFLSQFLISHPELLDVLIRADTATPMKFKDELRSELAAQLREAENYEELLDAIRRFRNTELIRVGINDIAEVISLLDVSAQLTSLADISIGEALKAAEKEVRSHFGAPLREGKEAVLSIIGMGKLGGGEMNYSSDLDLIFIHSGAGETAGPRVITNQEYFAKVAQRVISFLTLQTREGYLYKVDTRLRPSGGAGALVSSLDSFRSYHKESSRLWERQALIKARLVAGDPSLGKMVMDDISSFVYERGIDDDGRKEMVHLRERMEKELANEGPGRYNVKLGHGGIVDIEFIVQYLQLKYGREVENLRRQGTLVALRELFDAALLTGDVHSTLKDAYLFLMKTENRLRILHNISTDQMELGDKKLSKLARRLGYHGDDPGGQFLKDYKRHTERVREIYNRILSIPSFPPLVGGD